MRDKTEPGLDQSQPGGTPPATPPAPPFDWNKFNPLHVLDLMRGYLVLLQQIRNAVQKLVAGKQPFSLLIVVDNAGTIQRQGATNAHGVVRWVHNPTAGAITLTLNDGISGAKPLFNASLGAGASQEVWIPFQYEICASNGSSCQIGGYYRP